MDYNDFVQFSESDSIETIISKILKYIQKCVCTLPITHGKCSENEIVCEVEKMSLKLYIA